MRFKDAKYRGNGKDKMRIRKRISKVLFIFYKAMTGQAPSYISKLLLLKANTHSYKFTKLSNDMYISSSYQNT